MCYKWPWPHCSRSNCQSLGDAPLSIHSPPPSKDRYDESWVELWAISAECDATLTMEFLTTANILDRRRKPPSSASPRLISTHSVSNSTLNNDVSAGERRFSGRARVASPSGRQRVGRSSSNIRHRRGHGSRLAVCGVCETEKAMVIRASPPNTPTLSQQQQSLQSEQTLQQNERVAHCLLLSAVLPLLACTRTFRRTWQLGRHDANAHPWTRANE
jgi:hypothetical protein